MNENRLVQRCSAISGLILIVIALLHASIGYNEILIAIKTGGIGKDYSATVRITWLFSALTIFLTGTWLLILGKDLRNNSPKAWWPAIFIAMCLLIFGAASWWYFAYNPLAIAIVAAGSILIVPLLLKAPKFHQRKR